jgi:hypothetical protein
MSEAEAQIRKAHKKGSGTDRLANAARLGALERNINVKIKRHRNPDQIASPDQGTKEDKDEVIFLSSESG